MSDSAIWLTAAGIVLTISSCVLLLGDGTINTGTPRSRWSWVEHQEVALRQAGAHALRVWAWIGGRLGLSLAAGLLAWAYFGVLVLAPLVALVVHHIIGLGLERRRRRTEEARQQALLDAIRYGAAVMARAGNPMQMIRALAQTGPVAARPLFTGVVDDVDAGQGRLSLPDTLQRQAEGVADPLFDDLVVAVTVSVRYGAKLVPALETLLADWEQRVALRQEARALRAGQELAVRILPLALFSFLCILQLISPDLVRPLRTPIGELLIGVAVASMTYGYRVLQRMASEPATERLRLAPNP